MGTHAGAMQRLARHNSARSPSAGCPSSPRSTGARRAALALPSPSRGRQRGTPPWHLFSGRPARAPPRHTPCLQAPSAAPNGPQPPPGAPRSAQQRAPGRRGSSARRLSSPVPPSSAASPSHPAPPAAPARRGAGTLVTAHPHANTLTHSAPHRATRSSSGAARRAGVWQPRRVAAGGTSALAAAWRGLSARSRGGPPPPRRGDALAVMSTPREGATHARAGRGARGGARGRARGLLALGKAPVTTPRHAAPRASLADQEQLPRG